MPKRIALGAPERIAALVARPMRVVSRVTAPLVRILTGSTNLILRLLGIRALAEQGLTEEEIRALLEQGAETGVVEPVEHKIMESVFRMGDRSVRAIMTPRPDVEWIDIADDQSGRAAPLAAELLAERRARYLACEEELDQVVGFVHAEDLLARCLVGDVVDRRALRAVARPPVFVPASTPVLRLVDTLRASRQSTAVVLDEYGGVASVATLHDVLEAMVGDLPSANGEGEAEEPSIVRREDGSWLVDGGLTAADVEAELDLDLGGEGRTDYQTVAGFVLARLGRLPQAGEYFTWRGHRFEVMDMDGRRVDKVLIAPVTEGSGSEGSHGGTNDTV